MPTLSRRIRGRINEENYKSLMAASRRKGNSQSKEINAALSSFYSYERDDRRDARLLERLDMMMRHNHRHSRDMNLLTEILALFLHYFFTMAPDQNAADQDARAARGVAVLNRFIDQLGQKMKSGGRTFKRALEDVLVTDEDFFKLEELELLRALKGDKPRTVENAKSQEREDA